MTTFDATPLFPGYAKWVWADGYKDRKWYALEGERCRLGSFKCLACSFNAARRAHHLFYERGRQVWEYSLDALWPLCEECHPFWDRVREQHVRAPEGLLPLDMMELRGFEVGCRAQNKPKEIIELPGVNDELRYLFIMGVAKAFDIPPDVVSNVATKYSPKGIPGNELCTLRFKHQGI